MCQGGLVSVKVSVSGTQIPFGVNENNSNTMGSESSKGNPEGWGWGKVRARHYLLSVVVCM